MFNPLRIMTRALNAFEERPGTVLAIASLAFLLGTQVRVSAARKPEESETHD